MRTRGRAAAGAAVEYDLIPPDPVRRRNSAPLPPRPVVEDAVFEVIAIRPAGFSRSNDNPARRAGSRSADMPAAARLAHFGGRLAARVERVLSGLSPQAFVTLVAAIALSAFWLLGGFSAISAGRAIRPSGADFALVDTVVATEDANGMKVVSVSTGFINLGRNAITAPRLRVVSAKGNRHLGVLEPMIARLGSGETLRYAGRFKLDGGKSGDIAIIPERR
jgi:hypothetical protein